MKKYIILIIIAVIIFGNFETYKELNDLAIVSGIAIDKSKDNEYEITAQILIPKALKKSTDSSQGGSSIIEYKSKAKTVQMALRNIVYKSPKKLYLGHLQLVVLSEKIAAEDINKSLDFFLRDTQTNKDFLVVVAKGCRATDITSIVTPLQDNPIKNIVESIRTTSKQEGITNSESFQNILSVVYDNGIELALPSVEIEKSKDEKKDNSKDKKEEEKILISNMAYFKNNKFINYMNKNDSIAYNILKGFANRVVVQIKKDNSYFATEIYDVKCSIIPRKEKNKFYFDINVKGKAVITELKKREDFSNSKIAKEYEGKISEYVKANIKDYIKNCKEKYKVDVIGYASLINKYYHNDYNRLAKNFEKTNFKDVEERIDIDIDLEREEEIVNNEKEKI